MNPIDAPNLLSVAVVDDHAMMREGMKLFFDNTADLKCLWTAETAAEAVRRVEEETPDVLIVDISLPDRSGLELIKDVRLLRPKLLILAMSMHDEKLYAQRALKAGARGYVMKNAPLKSFEKALRRVAAGCIALSEEMSDEILKSFTRGAVSEDANAVSTLSDREFEIFTLISRGRSGGQIAEALKISAKTVDVHKMNIRGKLGMHDPGELTYFAIRWAEAQKGGKVD